MGEEDVNIYKQIEVRPFVDFRGLEEVMVITNPPPASADPMRSFMPTTSTTKGTGKGKGTTTTTSAGGRPAGAPTTTTGTTTR